MPEIDFKRTPVTLIVAGLALALEIVSNLDPERRDWYYNEMRLGVWYEIWNGELWRPFTTTLLHANFVHALFNIYMLYLFGSAVERWLGPFRALGLILLLGYISTLAEYVVGFYFLDMSQGARGLSGIVYGLFGLAWFARRNRPELWEVCDEGTVRVLMAWFFFCILATNFGWMRVANIAHGVGLLLGVLIALSIYRARQRWIWISLTAAITIGLLATLIAAPGHPGYEFAQRARALEG